jgi:hypothetical protein
MRTWRWQDRQVLQSFRDRSLMPILPPLEHARPVAQYRLGPYLATVYDEIPGGEIVTFWSMLFTIHESPVLLVTAEESPVAQELVKRLLEELGPDERRHFGPPEELEALDTERFLCAFVYSPENANASHVNFGAEPMADRETFVEAALRIGASELDVDEPAARAWSIP